MIVEMKTILHKQDITHTGISINSHFFFFFTKYWKLKLFLPVRYFKSFTEYEQNDVP